jgi:hypothetical protein
MGALHPKVAAWKREAISTIEDEGSVEEAREAWEQMRASVTTGS